MRGEDGHSRIPTGAAAAVASHNQKEIIMSRFKNKLIAMVVVGVLASIGTLVNSRQAVAQSGGPNVTLVSPIPLPVRAVENEFQPVSAASTCSIVLPLVNCNGELYTVPAGKRLVIEHFSVFANLASAGETGRASLYGGGANTIYLPLLPPAIPAWFPGAMTSGGQAVRMYVNGSGTV